MGLFSVAGFEATTTARGCCGDELPVADHPAEGGTPIGIHISISCTIFGTHVVRKKRMEAGVS